MTTLILPVAYNFQFVNSAPITSTKLGDGYSLDSGAYNQRDTQITISANITTQTKLTEVLDLFESLAGKEKFDWRPSSEYPLRSWFCESWNIRWEADNLWILGASFNSR
jgi:phage-related protein